TGDDEARAAESAGGHAKNPSDGDRTDHGEADAAGAGAGGDPAIGEPTRSQTGDGRKRVDGSAEPSHAGDRIAMGVDEIEREPRKDEVERIVGAEMADAGAPELALGEEFAKAWFRDVGVRGGGFVGERAGERARVDHPRDEPQEGDDSEADEEKAPAGVSD